MTVVLDPNYKMKYVAFCSQKLYYEDEVKTKMDSINSTPDKLDHFYTTNYSNRQ